MPTLGERLRPSTSVKDWVSPTTTTTVTPYVRPVDWLTLPTLVAGTQKFVGLYAVYPGGSNHVTLTVAGAYTVDWGDGTAPQNVATGVAATHNTTYASVPGTDSTRGYRQAIVTVTPQAGSNLTSVNLNVNPTGVGLIAGHSSLWLDVAIVGASLATFTASGTSARANLLEQFAYVGPSALTNIGFSGAKSLRSIIGTAWTATVTQFTQMFLNCSALQSVPLLNTAAGTNFTQMFSGCSVLQTVPLLNTAAGINFSGMFQSCSALQSVPLLNTGNGTNFSGMFQSCSVLQTVPLLNTAAGTNVSVMFSGCSALQSVPLLNTGNGTNLSGMFQSCTVLQTVPLLNTAAATDFSSMFSGCTSLQTIPPFNTAAGSSFPGMFQTCPSLAVGALTGTKNDISYASCKLSATELNAIYTALGTVVGKTITVTPNWGTATDDPTIATAKGWTVT